MASLVHAGGTLSYSQFSIARIGKGNSRNTYLCLVPDTQNIVSQDDELGGTQAEAATTCKPVQDASCSAGGTCLQSPYCDGNWMNTGRRMMRNLAYELTGQIAKIDWTGISGTDATRSFIASLLDHPRCDAILLMGDLLDVDEVIIKTTDPNYADLATVDAYQNGQRQTDTVREFLQIIRASGIPLLIVGGNHDPDKVLAGLVADISYTAASYFFATAPSGFAWAIKFPTPLGISMCAIGMPIASQLFGTGGTYNNSILAADAAWRIANIGCGASLPTILVSHGLVTLTVQGTTTGAFEDAANASVDNASCVKNLLKTPGNSAVWMLAGGHYTAGAFSAKSLIAAATAIANGFTTATCAAGNTAFSYFAFAQNWQEQNRHGQLTNAPYGNTPSDSAGLYYTVVAIDPDAKNVSAWDWSPYWLTRGDPPNGSAGLTSTLSQSFDFCARFGC